MNYRCKACGAELVTTEECKICTCEFCGTTQTLPIVKNDNCMRMYERANHFLRIHEFDQAKELLEQILIENGHDASVYWSLVLCKYGVEYVEDPQTRKRIPTVNRTHVSSIMVDEDYLSAIQYGTEEQRSIYEAEAKTLEAIQKGILAISEREAPFDVFLCYKEKDQEGRRTKDSVLAQELYEFLTESGMRVFYARISLEDRLGKEYEPYIYAALQSAKAMVVLGTKPEHFMAPWVKNEWKRFLAMSQDGSRKLLIPAYKDMDPYNLPDDFSHLQAQDMNRLGFMQDVKRSIQRLFEEEKTGERVVRETIVYRKNGRRGKKDALLERGRLALLDEEWEDAESFFEDVLMQEPECPEAHLGKLLAVSHAMDQEQLMERLFLDIGDIQGENVAAKLHDVQKREELAEKYYVPGFLSKNEILCLYNYDKYYTSKVAALQRKYAEIEKTVDHSQIKALCIQYDLKEQLTRIENEQDAWKQKLLAEIAKQQELDAKEEERILGGYDAFIKQAEEKMDSLYRQALQDREAFYKELLVAFRRAETSADYQELQKQFERCKNYEEADQFAIECEAKARELELPKGEKNTGEGKIWSYFILGIILLVLFVALLVMPVYFLNQ